MKLSQYFNIQGIKKIFSIFHNRNLIKPHLRIKSVLDIDINALYNNHNIRYVIFDKDNTLNLPNQLEFSSEYKNKLNEFKMKFNKKNIGIISNTVGSKDDKQYKSVYNHPIFPFQLCYHLH